MSKSFLPGLDLAVTMVEAMKVNAAHIADNMENVETKTAEMACPNGFCLNTGVK
jgi:hypothetical protein